MKDVLAREILSTTIPRLDAWIDNNGWAGYDPYDIKQYRLYQRLSGGSLPRSVRFCFRKVIGYAEGHHAIGLRKCLKIPKRINAKGMGLFARAYLNLYRVRRQDCYLAKADECLQWLIENSALDTEPSKLGWGYPFTWYAGFTGREVFPPNTPLSVVTTVSGHAFLDRFDLFGKPADVESAGRCARFLLEDLNRDEINDEVLCFSYSPLDNFHVINANLNVAAFLTRLSRYVDDDKMLDIGRRARKFSVSMQNGDGSWFYWAPPDLKFWSIDNYHTGIKLEWLWLARQYDPTPPDKDNLSKGLSYYTTQLFESDGAPKMGPFNPYPYDVHSAAQAIVTLSLLKQDYPECGNMLAKVVRWTLGNLSNPDGSFAYRIYPGGIERAPYIRWGQAWMLWALSCAVQALSNVATSIDEDLSVNQGGEH